MNLVEVATWIQEGYKEYYEKTPTIVRPIAGTVQDYVMAYVMRKGKGHLNPALIRDLVVLETSVPDQDGMVQC